jgi:hypothetical protein
MNKLSLFGLVTAASITAGFAGSKDALVIGPVNNKNQCIEVKVPKNAVGGSPAAINRSALNKVEVKVIPCPPINKPGVTRAVPVRK